MARPVYEREQLAEALAEALNADARGIPAPIVRNGVRAVFAAIDDAMIEALAFIDGYTQAALADPMDVGQSGFKTSWVRAGFVAAGLLECQV